MGTRLFTLQIGRFEIQYDRDYGIDKRRGWTVVYDGRVCEQFASNPVKAILHSMNSFENIRPWRKWADAQPK